MSVPEDAARPPSESTNGDFGDPHQGQVPSTAITERSSHPWWRRKKIVWGAAGVALTLVAALTAVSLWPDDSDREPFDRAVQNLAAAPTIHYKNSVLGGSMEWDIRVSRYDEAIGTISLAGFKLGVLAVDGRTFLRAPDSFPGLIDQDKVEALSDKWITGPLDSIGALIRNQLQPHMLATMLSEALSGVSEFPNRDTAGQTVNGVAALQVATPRGQLFVARDEPYRVLRFSPDTPRTSDLPNLPDLPELPSLPPRPTGPSFSPPPLPSLPATPNSFAAKPPTPLGRPAPEGLVTELRTQPPLTPTLGQVDLTEMTDADIDQFYEQMADEAAGLIDAIDASIVFQVQGEASFAGCGPPACSVTVAVRNTFDGKDITNKQITANLNVSMTFDGKPAGGCSNVAPLPVNATGSISCTNVSPTWTAAYLAAQQQDRAAIAARRPPPPHQYAALANVVARAMAQPDVDAILRQLEDNKRKPRRSAPTTAPPVASDPAATRPNRPSGRASTSSSATPRDCPAKLPENKPSYGDMKTVTFNGQTGQVATSARACITVIPEIRDTTRDPPFGQDTSAGHQRGHLIGEQFGGHGRVNNIVPQFATSNKNMATMVENKVVAAVRGERRKYYLEVTPIYSPDNNPVPTGIHILAQEYDGSGGFYWNEVIPNNP